MDYKLKLFIQSFPQWRNVIHNEADIERLIEFLLSVEGRRDRNN